MPMNPLVRIVGLQKSFGSLAVLKGINLDVNAGERVSIIGPSGSGKTTLLRCINFLERPSGGEIWVDGKRVGQAQAKDRTRYLSDREIASASDEIGFVLQRFNLFPHLSSLYNFTLAPKRVRKLFFGFKQKTAYEMLEKVGLGHKV